MRFFADCRLTASILPTEISAKPDGARLLPRNSVGSRQFTSPSYGGVLTPPTNVAAISHLYLKPPAKGNCHAGTRRTQKPQ